MVSRLHWLAPLALLSFSGCRDTTRAVGEHGRVEYTLVTSYDVPQGDLRDARLVTGHEQTLELELTDRGRRDIGNPARLQHRISPALHAQASTDADGSGDASVKLTVDDPGVYTVESLLHGEVMDAIDLEFARPAGFEVLVRVRPPWGETFREVASGGTIEVEQGSQITLQPIPVDASRRRLAGKLHTRVDVAPDWAVTPGVGVLDVDEWGVWAVKGALDFYLVEPGALTFTFRDTVNDVATTQAFEVGPVER